MFRKKGIVLLVSLLILSLTLVGCGGDKAPQQSETPQDGDAIVIGVYEPLTGDNAAGGQMTLEGMQLANKMFPQVLGKDVELVVVDNRSEKPEAANAVTKLIDDHKASVILGSYSSGLSMAGGQVALNKEVPVIGCSPTNPLVTKG
ncbi:MAG: ABC transporter substrate-binding protein, partial [Clostridia bacterium]|nr:ABC transporter substrate-binding protein [Clostridia bacterium]